jgi:hypothetical protein
MGLLDTWQEWKKSKQGNSFGEDFSGMNSDIQSPTLNTAGGITNPSYNRNESPLVKNPIFTKRILKKQVIQYMIQFYQVQILIENLQ